MTLFNVKNIKFFYSVMEPKSFIFSVESEESPSHLRNSLQSQSQNKGFGSLAPIPTTPTTPTIASLPIWARRERLMKRHRTLTYDSQTPHSSVDETDNIEDLRRRGTKTIQQMHLKSEDNTNLLNVSSPIQQKDILRKDTRFLMPPTPLELGLMRGEKEPHRKVIFLTLYYFITY